MDATTVAIAVLGSLLFFGVLIWKAVWFIRKINEDPADEGSSGAPGRADGEPPGE